nr:MAG TPA: hypothetical protein [Caudoviricetes sp.]
MLIFIVGHYPSTSKSINLLYQGLANHYTFYIDYKTRRVKRIILFTYPCVKM